MAPARFIPPLLFFLSLLAASCGGGPPGGPSGSSPAPQRPEATAAAPTETTVEETTPAPESTAEKVVEIRALQYLPGPVAVSAGTTVRWVNEDRALHTVTSESPGGPLRSEKLGRGGSYEFTFKQPG